MTGYLRTAALAVALLAAEAHAFIYSDTDLLLTFHLDATRNDLTFNLGSVSNFLNRPSGSRIVVTNWDPQLVRDNYDGSLAGVLFTLQAAVNMTGNRQAWLTIASSGTPTDVSGSLLGQIRSKVAGVGLAASNYSRGSAAMSFVISPTDASAYSTIVSDNHTSPLSTLGGRAPGTLESPLTPCTIEASVPNTMRFFQINVSSALPKPAASQVGSFSLDPSGVLTFTAGADTTVPPAPVITGISRAGNVTSVRVQTTNGPTYRLLYADVVNLTQPVTNWTAGASLPGTGGIITLEDMTGTGVRFYRAEAR